LKEINSSVDVLGKTLLNGSAEVLDLEGDDTVGSITTSDRSASDDKASTAS
jgi:hypothetical protein